MKMVRIAAFVIIAAMALAGAAAAAHHEGSVEKGKALFNDPKLGTTGKSCNDCHKDGKGIEKAAVRKDLETVVNNCITQGLKGKALDAGSVEMQSLVKYIKSLKVPPVGC
jgi:cytochrome c peroxidase